MKKRVLADKKYSTRSKNIVMPEPGKPWHTIHPDVLEEYDEYQIR